jgi:CheY-like chemotaxis protein
MDVQMPKLNGLEAATRLRERHWNGRIVALTATSSPEYQQCCLAAGCDGYLRKPISQQDLIHMLSQYLPRGG